MKGKGRSHWSSGDKIGLPLVLFLSFFFFLLGFFSSSLLYQDSPTGRFRARVLESTTVNFVEDATGFDLLPSGESGDDSFSSIPFQVLSWRPRVQYYPKFATAQQCDSIIGMAKPQLEPSMLALRSGETSENTKGVRTSSGMFIGSDEDESGVLDIIDEKIAKATMIPRANGEAYNILRYEIGQSYQCHYDAFNPSEYGPQKSQRIASFLLYLSDVQEGGETMFPFEDDNVDINYDFKECIGLKVQPRKGDGILFYSLFTNGTIDPASLHGSCPVIRGEKWVATKWIRDHTFED